MARDRDKLDKLAGLSPEMQKGLHKLDKLAGASPELQKGLATAAKIHDMLGQLRKRCDDVRQQMEEVVREDLVAQQRRFFQGAPLNGTHHGQQTLSKILKGE